jgi:hypothetical protein
MATKKSHLYGSLTVFAQLVYEKKQEIGCKRMGLEKFNCGFASCERHQ